MRTHRIQGIPEANRFCQSCRIHTKPASDPRHIAEKFGPGARRAAAQEHRGEIRDGAAKPGCKVSVIVTCAISPR